ncbi:MAG: 50S ribosomal protein L17 [Verrucomicrobiae bacterium]|nr:50S ribosomal protein L17 [Verrucomicrobiae bacterium]
MRHRNKTLKLGRKSQHRFSMLSNMVCSLIKHGRVKTTLQKAKAVSALADKMVTLAKKGTLHHRRQAIQELCQEDVVRKLFAEVGPRSSSRSGGYTRVIKAGRRIGDAGKIAYLEWVDAPVVIEAAPTNEGKEAKAGAAPAAQAGGEKKS